MHKCSILCNWWIKRKNLSWGLNLLLRRFPRLVGPNQRAIWDWKPLHHPWESCGGRMILSLSIQFRNKNHNNIVSHHLTHFSLGFFFFLIEFVQIPLPLLSFSSGLCIFIIVWNCGSRCPHITNYCSIPKLCPSLNPHHVLSTKFGLVRSFVCKIHTKPCCHSTA